MYKRFIRFDYSIDAKYNKKDFEKAVAYIPIANRICFGYEDAGIMVSWIYNDNVKGGIMKHKKYIIYCWCCFYLFFIIGAKDSASPLRKTMIAHFIWWLIFIILVLKMIRPINKK